MFREPEEETTTRVKSKIDQAAATSRSPIRRESTVRPSRYNASPSSRSDRSRNATARLLEDFRERASQSRPVAESDRQHLELEIERLRRRRESRSRIRWDAWNDSHENETYRRQAGEELLRDALQYERPGQRLRLPRPPRESALRFEVAPSPPISESDSRSTSPRRRAFTRSYIPSPPYSLNDHRTNRVAPDGPLPTNGSVSLTPLFAPAQGLYRDSASYAEDITHAVVDRLIDPGEDLQNSETPPTDSWDSSYPPLRRVGHLSPRPHHPGYDGLGDRQRSLSPPVSDSSVEEDTWETLLTTMEEDEHRPSAESSFTSAIASASTSRRSDSASRSGLSSQTTVDSLRDLEHRVDGPPCDPDDAIGSRPDPNLVDTSASRVGRAMWEAHAMMGRSSRAMGELRRLQRITNEDREFSASGAEERLRDIENRAMDTEAELAHMQSFIERMTRREDIPDEWWAAAGLSRTIREAE